MILGISGSPRADGSCSRTVQAALSSVKEESTACIALSGKQVSGCRACLECVEDNLCIQDDDWREMQHLLLNARAIIMAVPDYYNQMNALSHAFLERTFAFRHQGVFSLENVPFMLIRVDGGKGSQLESQVQTFVRSNRMFYAGSVSFTGFSQCYRCPTGGIARWDMCTIIMGLVVRSARNSSLRFLQIRIPQWMNSNRR